MKAVDLAAASQKDLVVSYREAAVEHANAVASGRHRVANRNHDVLVAISQELRARGGEGEKALANLLRDDNPAVQVWAASHSLPFAAAAAERVLAAVAAGPPSPSRLAAEMTLAEWKGGRL